MKAAVRVRLTVDGFEEPYGNTVTITHHVDTSKLTPELARELQRAIQGAIANVLGEHTRVGDSESNGVAHKNGNGNGAPHP